MIDSASAERGKQLFIEKCAHCHTIDKGDKHKFGPNMFGIMDKEAGKIPGYTYSSANKTIGITWTNENMSLFLENPKKFMPGTKMLYPLIKDAQDRNDIIAYLRKFVE